MRNYGNDLNLAEYQGRFSDGAPRGWSADYAAHRWSVSFPNGQSVEVSPLSRAGDWERSFASDASSSTLWFRSLRYILELRRDGRMAWGDVIAILKSFRSWLRAQESDWSELRSGSLDHQIALRLRVYCTLRSLAATGDLDTRTRDRLDAVLRDLVTTDVEIAEDLDLFIPNNHGIMLCISILHASTVFSDVTRAGLREDWLATLLAALADIIDDQGLAPENTVSYQIFYVNLISQIVDFLRWANIGNENARELESMMQRSREATSRMLLPNGDVPPLGDSPGGAQSSIRPRRGVLFSPTNGYFIVNDGQTYFSLKAGYRSVTHKQMDDGSVILWHRGAFIIRDAGLLSYDMSDSVALRIRGQEGHSSVAIRSFDSAWAHQVIRWSDNGSRIQGRLRLEDFEAPDFPVEAEVLFDDRGKVSRRVTRPKQTEFRFLDSLHTTGHGDAVVRFLLDPEARVKEEGGTVVVSVGGTRATFNFSMRVDGDAAPARVGVEATQIAIAHYRAVQSRSIVINLPSGREATQLETVVELQDG